MSANDILQSCPLCQQTTLVEPEVHGSRLLWHAHCINEHCELHGGVYKPSRWWAASRFQVFANRVRRVWKRHV